MQRAGDRRAVHQALAQRAALVRAAVQEREHLLRLRPEQGDVAVVASQHAAAQQRDVVQRADAQPAGGGGGVGSMAASGDDFQGDVFLALRAGDAAAQGSGKPSSANSSRWYKAWRLAASSTTRALT